MLSARLSVTCASLLAFCPGCSGGFGGHEPEPDLYPVLSERGHLTYSTNDPHAPPTPPSEKERWDKERRRQAQAQQDRNQGPQVIQGEFMRVEVPEPRPVPYDSQPDPSPSPVFERLEQQRQE